MPDISSPDWEPLAPVAAAWTSVPETSVTWTNASGGGGSDGRLDFSDPDNSGLLPGL